MPVDSLTISTRPIEATPVSHRAGSIPNAVDRTESSIDQLAATIADFADRLDKVLSLPAPTPASDSPVSMPLGFDEVGSQLANRTHGLAQRIEDLTGTLARLMGRLEV